MKALSVLATILVMLPLASGCSDPSGPVDIPVVESYYHERPAWSPDGSTIAFTMQRDSIGVYLVDTSGANVRRIKSGEGIGLTWSPDSKWLAFSASGLLYKMMATGDSLLMFGTGIPGIRPSWSPDGSKIAYSNSGLWLYTIATGGNVRLLQYGNFISWRSTNQDLVYLVSSSGGLNTASYEFRNYNLTTQQEDVLYPFTSTSDCAFSSLNPAGDTMVFSLRPFSGTARAQIVKVNIGNLVVTQLTTDGGDYPAWSPDGQQIVYTRTASGDGGLWIMNADGSGKHRLTQP